MGNKNKEELPNMKVGPDGKLIGEEIGTETPESLLSKMENPEENRKIQIQNKINEVLDETFGNKTIWKAILKGTGATSDLWDTYKNNSAVDTLEISDNRSGEVDPKFIPFMKALKKLRADSGILPESNTEPIEKYIERASEKVIDRIGTPEPSPVSTGV